MSELVTEARGEWWSASTWEWKPLQGCAGPVPRAVEMAREERAQALRVSERAAPVRVIDASGAVVQQWGRP